MIAFIGMGHLGSNFVRAMLKKEEQVQVWNRTFAKAKALETYGAKAFEQLSETVKGASRIHLTLKDDSSVDEVLAAASVAFQPNVMIIDHTTTSAYGAAERTERWKERGYIYLHAPVFMGPQNALDSTGYMLVSGDQSVINQLEPALKKMTGSVINFGDNISKAAGIKLIGNLLLISLTAGMADVLALAQSLNIPVTDIAQLFEVWNPAASVPARLKKMTSGNFTEPTWELNMARKDAQLMIEAASQVSTPLMVIPAVAEAMDQWIAKGHGNDDWTVIAKDALT
jgi:3-hydroxyisobutyrate dehydrogenase